jgi:hypothetical protein
MSFDRAEPRKLKCCVLTDAQCFDVTKRDEDRNPISHGPPLPNAMRATFLLVNGTHMDVTMDRAALEALTPDQYPIIWGRILASFVASPGQSMDWVRTQFDNGILALVRTQPWSEVNDRLH